MKIYFIRHGLPDYYSGKLLPEGVEQAKKTAEALKGVHFDLMYCTSLPRTSETGKYTAVDNTKQLLALEWASEVHSHANLAFFHEKLGYNTWIYFHEVYKKRCQELQDDPLWYKDELFPETVEKYLTDLGRHIDDWLLGMNIKHNRENHTFEFVGEVPETVAFFAHEGMGGAFISSLLEINYAYWISHFRPLGCCSISVITIEDGIGARLDKYNDTSHLGEK